MKTPKKIKVVKNAPANGQSGIQKIIGYIFLVGKGAYDAEEESVSINCPLHGGPIILQRAEYVVLEYQ